MNDDQEPGHSETIILPSDSHAEAQVKAQALNAELRKSRMILNADQMANLVAPRARHEISYDQLGAHFFSVDGVLMGKKIEGALFAGECMLVFATTLDDAKDLATRGLRSTVEIIIEEFDTRNTRELAVAQGLDQDRGGRRNRVPGSTLQTPQMQKLAAIMRTEIAGLPWKF